MHTTLGIVGGGDTVNSVRGVEASLSPALFKAVRV